MATRALFWLIPELPLYRNLPEPYRTMCMQWLAEGQNAKTQEVEEQVGKRIAFVESLVNTSKSNDVSTSVGGMATDTPTPELSQQKENSEHKKLRKNEQKLRKEADSIRLLRAREQKLPTKEYQAMLKSRAGLPMAEVKNDLLAKVRDNEVVVISGETGCGKTTQVPQYILDEMISAGNRDFCNIVCTQPRRIAAISVAEKVAVERCEPPPGNHFHDCAPRRGGRLARTERGRSADPRGRARSRGPASASGGGVSGARSTTWA